MSVELSVPQGYQLILGQSHFIKTVEDLYEALVTAMPRIAFGVAFCEASGKSLVRHDGTDEGCERMASDFALKLSAGHSFAVVLKESFPINVLNRIKAVEEVATVYCATSNKVSVIIADLGEGRGVLGVVDGGTPRAVESDQDKTDRKEFLRKIGYKR